MKSKKVVILLVLVVLILSAAISLTVIYNNVGAESVPDVRVSVLGATIEPVRYEWNTAVFGGLLHKPFNAYNINTPVKLGVLGFKYIDKSFEIPYGFDAKFRINSVPETIPTYTYMEQWYERLRTILDYPGDHSVSITLNKSSDSSEIDLGYGSFHFSVYFTIPETEIFTSRATLQQGEVFAIRLENVPSQVRPTATTTLGMSIFAPTSEGEWFVAIPVGNTRRPGTYTVYVTAGDFSWEKEVTVTTYDFQTQNLIIDTTNPVISQANSPAAFQQFRDRIPPLFSIYDDEIHWRGAFLRPVEGGRISTPFGAIRFTNSNWAAPRHHWGIDIAAPTGTPVIATNYGRVVLAEYLYNTGYTIVIEHGGGLKSLHYHLHTFYVEYNEMVQRGALIGTVGSTGFSTGPHLHFEFRIGDQAVNPLMLIEETAPLYSVSY